MKRHIEAASNYKTVYMWGCFGMPVTENVIREKSVQYPSWYTAEKQAALTGQGLRCTLSLRTW